MKINNLSPDKHKFLQILETIAKPPEILHILGVLPEARIPTVAIVGTRKPTSYGKEVTTKLAYELASRGVVIVSGLAFGIDSLAHRAALEAHGITIAVLANGLPDIYPRSHKALAEQIITHGGAVLSEYEPNTPALQYKFLERNRIVSGLSDAVIIPEAAIRSGSLNTARHALEQGREVFVVPGNINSPMSSGCNALIKQGAHVVTETNDILEIIAPESLRPQSQLALGDNPAQTNIIKLLNQGVRDGEELQQQSQLDASEFSTELTMLEINGIIKALGANQWTLR